MSKCSRCQNDFTPLLKSDGLPYKTCDRCNCTDKKCRDKHKEQTKLYGFSSLVKQKRGGKIALSFASPEKEKYFLFIYEVITWEKRKKSLAN